MIMRPVPTTTNPYQDLVRVLSPNQLRDWILAASPTDQESFMMEYLSHVLSGDVAVTPCVSLWKVALRFSMRRRASFIQLGDTDPSDTDLIKLVARYEHYIVQLRRRIQDLAPSPLCLPDRLGSTVPDADTSSPHPPTLDSDTPSLDQPRPDADTCSPDQPTPDADTSSPDGSAIDAANVAGSAATAAVIVPVAANAATVGVAWALGFQAGGVAAGSAAASMMSAAAVANGGSIAAGSMVAVMQSIGATGLAFGPVGWIASGVVSAAMGATVGVKYLLGKSKDNSPGQSTNP